MQLLFRLIFIYFIFHRQYFPLVAQLSRFVINELLKYSFHSYVCVDFLSFIWLNSQSVACIWGLNYIQCMYKIYSKMRLRMEFYMPHSVIKSTSMYTAVSQSLVDII